MGQHLPLKRPSVRGSSPAFCFETNIIGKPAYVSTLNDAGRPGHGSRRRVPRRDDLNDGPFKSLGALVPTLFVIFSDFLKSRIAA
jgi:hypothetical protein